MSNLQKIRAVIDRVLWTAGATANNRRLLAEAISESLAAPSVARSAPADELPPLPEPLEIDWPELHSQALGCGVEDRNIHDRYEAAEYGWQDGVDKAVERVPASIYDADQMHDYARAAVLAERAACEKLCNEMEIRGGRITLTPGDCADAIRARN